MEILFFRLYSVIFVILLRTAPQRSLESSQDFGHNIPFILCRNLLQLVILKAFFICLLTLLALPDILMSHAKKGKVLEYSHKHFRSKEDSLFCASNGPLKATTNKDKHRCQPRECHLEVARCTLLLKFNQNTLFEAIDRRNSFVLII
ncbi:hypothetical protein NPIL_504781 [Nephila pilipes]|uniref:Uncharacterized protein n=1 Tax=Nephila pilipes TaxID=299642 RepID=A0A8X6N2B3_NEPPI|nr:hypothetical protein NPIL_221881 [Nephila pilipes]GFU48309.1 hypothetical protein NPIL_504781 [Nephila pilipes]